MLQRLHVCFVEIFFYEFRGYLFFKIHELFVRVISFEVLQVRYLCLHTDTPPPEKPTNKPKKQKQKTPKNQQKKLTRENPRILDSDDS